MFKISRVDYMIYIYGTWYFEMSVFEISRVDYMIYIYIWYLVL